MCFLTLEDCSDSELHCIYHDPERTVTPLHPRTACSLQFYAPEEDHHAFTSTFHTRRPNNAHSWWLQLLNIAGSQLLGIAYDVVQRVITVVKTPEPSEQKVDREIISYHLTNLRSVIPHHDALDEEEHILTIQPPYSPWSWPSNTFYREACRGYIEYLTGDLIAGLVTHGLLLANDVGIRWKYMDQYILVKTEEPASNRAHRPRFEELDAPAFRHARIGRPGLHAEYTGLEERPGTPIVELGSPPLGMGEKRVRLCSKKTCVVVDREEQWLKRNVWRTTKGRLR